MIATDAVELLLVVLALVAVAAIGVVALAARRRAIARHGGMVELSLRLRTDSGARGWALGLGRFDGDVLQWYRVFSFSMRPRRTLSRRDLSVVAQRQPVGAERVALQAGAVVMECRSSSGPVELALAPSELMGFLAWLEARPPGATLPA